jgi:hypothetical protein
LYETAARDGGHKIPDARASAGRGSTQFTRPVERSFVKHKQRHCDLTYIYLRSRVDSAKLHFDLNYNRNGGVTSLAFRYGVVEIDDGLADWLAKFKSIDVTTVFQEWSRRDDRPWRQ